MAAESQFLFYALIMGIFITFVYDILRIFRRVVPHNNFWVSVEDLLFWIYCAAEVFLLMYYQGNGTLRWFAILGALVGMGSYKKLISPFFVKYVTLVLNKLIEPIVKVGKWIWRPIGKGASKIRKATGNVRQQATKKRRHIKWRLKKKLTFLVKMLKMTL